MGNTISDRPQMSMSHVPDELIDAQDCSVVEFEGSEWFIIKNWTDFLGGKKIYLIPVERKTP